jgi:hypothetical protein
MSVLSVPLWCVCGMSDERCARSAYSNPLARTPAEQQQEAQPKKKKSNPPPVEA